MTHDGGDLIRRRVHFPPMVFGQKRNQPGIDTFPVQYEIKGDDQHDEKLNDILHRRSAPAQHPFKERLRVRKRRSVEGLISYGSNRSRLRQPLQHMLFKAGELLDENWRLIADRGKKDAKR